MKVAAELERRLVSMYNAEQTEAWPWFEQSLSYDNALMPHALIVRGQSRGDINMQSIGLQGADGGWPSNPDFCQWRMLLADRIQWFL